MLIKTIFYGAKGANDLGGVEHEICKIIQGLLLMLRMWKRSTFFQLMLMQEVGSILRELLTHSVCKLHVTEMCAPERGPNSIIPSIIQENKNQHYILERCLSPAQTFQYFHNKGTWDEFYARVDFSNGFPLGLKQRLRSYPDTSFVHPTKGSLT